MQDTRIFFTLPQVSSNPPSIRWIEDPRLQRYIHQLDTLDRGLIAYHLVTTPATPTTNNCLTALLAHIAFIPGNRLRSTHAILQQYYTADLADLYQIGLEIVSQPRKFLSNFDPDRSVTPDYWYPTFYKWCRQKFDRRLTDTIRAQKGMSGFKRTDLGLVVRATAAKIVKAIVQQGYPTVTHPIYLALHSCLEKAVKAGRFDTTLPQAAHYAEVLALYRQRQVGTLDYAQIVSYLTQLGAAVRNYDRLRVESSDRVVSAADNRPLIDIIKERQDEAENTPLDKTIGAEYQQQVKQLKNTIAELLQRLSIDSDRLLWLLYGLALTQTETGRELKCNQTTVMRRNERVLATLAQNIYQQINDSSRTSSLSSEYLQRIVTQIVAFCQQYYPNLLAQTIQQIDPLELRPLIERVCVRWQIQLQPDGAAIARLTEIITQTPSTQP
ncbi:hypothetical protein [Chamaesiphon sp. GL140_3_metabinner_50]|uniref:hypothetical protein n=1 Tax=Chamaesiphon sp. GL140_3_metabinner_50 TaxID=2970812 RepID=UPI0025F8C225|nr:hypothetical protein [Chamaesiphon sp. GL140_3_metabinner_50]